MPTNSIPNPRDPRSASYEPISHSAQRMSSRNTVEDAPNSTSDSRDPMPLLADPSSLETSFPSASYATNAILSTPTTALVSQPSEKCSSSSRIQHEWFYKATARRLRPTNADHDGEGDKADGQRSSARQDAWSPWSIQSQFPVRRISTTCPSLYLRPGCRFHGEQQSQSNKYKVQVELKNVDLKNSYLCGYLHIEGLTEENTVLTTYFEGEIIGEKYTFATQHSLWGATCTDDLKHWSRFDEFEPFKAQGLDARVEDPLQREHIFMRWKERFLVPNHRVVSVQGASFEGFYYICFNQLKGGIKGLYFHRRSEWFQKLELEPSSTKGCFSAFEMR